MILLQIMKVVVVYVYGVLLWIEEVKVLLFGFGQVLVKIEVFGVCYIDLYVVEGDWLVKLLLLFIFGYEGVGYVVVVGSGVIWVKEGDWVGIFWLYIVCGCCEYCLIGWEIFCESQQNIGYLVNGGYVEYVLVDLNYVGILLKNVEFVEIVLIFCVGVIVYKGFKQINVCFGQWVVIFGIGGFGYVVVQYVRVMGLYVVVIDIDDVKLELVCKFGVSLMVNVWQEDLVEVFQCDIGGVYGVLVIVVFNSVFGQVIGMVCCGGIIVLVGLLLGDFLMLIFDVVFKGLYIVGFIVGICVDFQEVFDFVGEGLVKVIIYLGKLDDINQIFDQMCVGQIEGCIVFEM